MFTKEGPVQLTVGDVQFAEPRFPEGRAPSDFDIYVEVSDETGANDWARMEWSENYARGNLSSMKQREITMRTLRGIGFEGEDLSTLSDFLRGRSVPGVVKKTEKDGKKYYNVYLGSGGGNAPSVDKVLTQEELKRRLTGGGGISATAPAAAEESGATPKPRNPFAKR